MNNDEVIALLRQIRKLAGTAHHNMDNDVDPNLALALGQVIGLIDARLPVRPFVE